MGSGELRHNDAVRLFAERAAAATGTFEITAANQAAVAELCRRLDGLPLAIEFAAVRTRVLSAEQILGRLTDRFGLLGAGKLGVGQVSGGGRVALPRQREFTALKLQQSGEQETTRQRCAEYYSIRCGQSALESRHQLADWLAWADLEIDNIRAVLHWCARRGDATRGTTLAASLSWYWITRATTEGARWLDDFLVAASADAPAHGWACFVRGFLAVLKNEPPTARSWLGHAIATARSTGQRELLTEALAMASIAEDSAGDHACARAFPARSMTGSAWSTCSRPWPTMPRCRGGHH